MSDSILDEENIYSDDIAESISKSYDSKTNKKSKNNTESNHLINYNSLEDKKKIRRSRIIISDTNHIINENKKDIYDTETKLKKSIFSAICFNEHLNSTRQETSKVFLKRKIKAAFEREPIDRNKGFFNVPFIPTLGMLSVLTSSQQMPNTLPSQHTNRPVNLQNPSQSYNPNNPPKFASNPNVNFTSQINPKNDQTVVINLNKPKEDSNIISNKSVQNKISINSNVNTDNIPKIISTNYNNQTSNSIIQSVSNSRYIPPINPVNSNQNKTINLNTKHLFNVNQSYQNFTDISKNVSDPTKNQSGNINPSNRQVMSNSFDANLSEEKEIKYQINASNINKNSNILADSDFKINEKPSNIHNNINPNHQGSSQGLNLLNLSPEEFKKLKPEQIEQINKALRQKAQMQQQQQNMNNNNTNPNIKTNQMGNTMMSNMQIPNSNANFAELIRQQQNSIYMQIIDSYKNDPEKFKSEITTSELLKLHKLISMSNKIQTDPINQMNIQNNHFVVSNLIPKEETNNSYQFNLQLLQSIQKQIQSRGEMNQSQNVNLTNTNSVNNNMNIQLPLIGQMNQQNNFIPKDNIKNP